MIDAPDRYAPWMARDERPGMARARPAHRSSVPVAVAKCSVVSVIRPARSAKCPVVPIIRPVAVSETFCRADHWFPPVDRRERSARSKGAFARLSYTQGTWSRAAPFVFVSFRTSVTQLTIYRLLALAAPIALLGIGLVRKAVDPEPDWSWYVRLRSAGRVWYSWRPRSCRRVSAPDPTSTSRRRSSWSAR